MNDKIVSDRLLDIALEQSFPASDPPAVTAAFALAGRTRATLADHRAAQKPLVDAGAARTSRAVSDRRSKA
jgi:hypothetical protein